MSNVEEPYIQDKQFEIYPVGKRKPRKLLGDKKGLLSGAFKLDMGVRLGLNEGTHTFWALLPQEEVFPPTAPWTLSRPCD